MGELHAIIESQLKHCEVRVLEQTGLLLAWARGVHKSSLAADWARRASTRYGFDNAAAPFGLRKRYYSARLAA